MFSDPENMRVSWNQAHPPPSLKAAAAWGHAAYNDHRQGRLCHRPGSADERNVPFYQTNPPFFDGFFNATTTTYGTYSGNVRNKSVGSFWKTNPPGGCFGGVRMPRQLLRG